MLANQFGLRDQICRTLFRYVFLSDPGLKEACYEAAVGLGFARFRTDSMLQHRAQADETLPLLAGVSWLTEQESMSEYINGLLQMKPTEGYELFIAYWFASVFKRFANVFESPVKLSDVFEFSGIHRPAWADEQGQLVTVNILADGTTQYAEVGFTGARRAVSTRLGYKSNSPEATLEWLLNPRHTAFCFPDANMGPDICFFLRLENGLIIPVFVKVEWQNKPVKPFNLRLYQEAARRYMLRNGGRQRNIVSTQQCGTICDNYFSRC
jgi:hypothetical protein